MFTSYRWLTVTNVSEVNTSFLKHKECGENKVQFSNMRLKARSENRSGKQLKVESTTNIQPNFTQSFKIYFDSPLAPGESKSIFYRLDWPGECGSYYEEELSTSISLTRYRKGVSHIIFGIVSSASLYAFELWKTSQQFEEINISGMIRPYDVKDDPDLEPLHDKNLQGCWFEADVEDAMAYRIHYKLDREIIDDDDGDF